MGFWEYVFKTLPLSTSDPIPLTRKPCPLFCSIRLWGVVVRDQTAMWSPQCSPLPQPGVFERHTAYRGVPLSCVCGGCPFRVPPSLYRHGPDLSLDEDLGLESGSGGHWFSISSPFSKQNFGGPCFVGTLSQKAGGNLRFLHRGAPKVYTNMAFPPNRNISNKPGSPGIRFWI